MFKYEFVTVKTKRSIIKTKKSYQDIINANAQNGWRLLQIIDRSFIHGEIELIFEKQLD